MNNDTTVQHWVVVPAAGTGRRMLSRIPKQYLDLNGVPVLSRTLQRLHDGIQPAAIVVAIRDDDSEWPKIKKPDCRIVLTDGGRERSDSVLNGLRALNGLAADDDWIWVHDAARPCVRVDDLKKLSQEVDKHETGGLLALRATDTMKQVDDRNQCVATINRKTLWRALTPQVFRYSVLLDALEKALNAGYKVTDESQAIELLGLQPCLVEGHEDNIKITQQGDLDIAALYLRRQATERG